MQTQITTHIKVMAFDLRVVAGMTSKQHDSLRHSRQQRADRQRQHHMADDSPATCQSQPGLGP